MCSAQSLKDFIIVVAATTGSLGIGKGGGLPWKLPGDMAFFKRVTSNTSIVDRVNAVIMGRKTWESIPSKFRPLAGRCNVILSRNINIRRDLALPEDVLVAHSLEEALAKLADPSLQHKIDQVFVIGGGAVYREAVAHPKCRTIKLTSVHSDKFEDCDAFFPPLPDAFRLIEEGDKQEEGGVEYSFDTYERVVDEPVGTSVAAAPRLVIADENRPATNNILTKSTAPAKRSALRPTANGVLTKPSAPVAKARSDQSAGDATTSTPTTTTSPPPNTEEMQYLNLVKEILETGAVRGDRTGTGTLSKFGVQMRFSLRNNRFPLLTTKRVFWRGVAEELLWFVAGCTNANTLRDKGIHIWDGNGSRAFLDNLGLTHREEGDLGPVYGFQWRHFGAEYTDMNADYSGKGIDQLAKCIEKIKNSPEDRRIILTAWNPSDLGKMALPPCHMFCQFYVAGKELSCQMYQRSADMGLGVPFNIASYSLLTRMVAQVCGLEPGDFIHTIGDAHVYLNHVDALKEQLKRTPLPFPTLTLNPSKMDIDEFEMSDFTLQGYTPMGAIKMNMAV